MLLVAFSIVDYVCSLNLLVERLFNATHSMFGQICGSVDAMHRLRNMPFQRSCVSRVHVTIIHARALHPAMDLVALGAPCRPVGRHVAVAVDDDEVGTVVDQHGCSKHILCCA